MHITNSCSLKNPTKSEEYAAYYSKEIGGAKLKMLAYEGRDFCCVYLAKFRRMLSRILQ